MTKKEENQYKLITQHHTPNRNVVKHLQQVKGHLMSQNTQNIQE